jgi:hypothetical protein
MNFPATRGVAASRSNLPFPTFAACSCCVGDDANGLPPLAKVSRLAAAKTFALAKLYALWTDRGTG